MLQCWRSGFDPIWDISCQNLVWDKLLRLPLELWNEVAIRDIGNRIGTWGFFGQLDKRLAWVLVEMDFGRGILANLEVRWSTSSFNISIDYWGIPFHCVIFHEIRHLKNVCPQRFDATGGHKQSF